MRLRVDEARALQRRQGGSMVLTPVLLAAMALTSGCAMWPVAPVSTGVTSPPRVAPAAAPAPATPSTPNDPAPVVQPTPVAPLPPYSPAVVARFPEPVQNYDSPAFQPGRSSFTSNSESAQWLRRLVQDGGGAPGGVTVRLYSLGLSQRGTPLEALLFTRSPQADPAGVLREGRPTVLLIGQQHGDEPAGGEALLTIAQRLARGSLQPLLDQINVVVMPRANPDGADAGRRVTENGLDANRDHLLLNTPEAQAQALLVREFKPVVVVDAHEYPVLGAFQQKFAALPRADLQLQYAMTANMPEFITKAAQEWFHEPLVNTLKAQGLSHDWYHTTTSSPNDRKLSMGGSRPDTARNVQGLKNAVSLLIESRGLDLGRLHFKRRVHSQVVALGSVLQSTANRAADLMKLRRYVDNEVASRACTGQAVLEALPTPSEYTLLAIDPVSGADKSLSVAWDSSLLLSPVKSRARPCGYWLAASENRAVQRLRSLGVQVQEVMDLGAVRGEVYRELQRDNRPRDDVRGPIDDGGRAQQLVVGRTGMLIDMGPGSFYVPMNQPLGNLVLAAMEPDTQSSFAAHQIVSSVAAVARVLALPEVRMQAVP